MQTAIGSVDANNFYVSCERAFDPMLLGRPVVVLSNNDGCIIARSEEAKAAGVGMGAPLFKTGRSVEEHGVAVYSSNYALYGDMSRRVMEALEEFTPEVEVYSIDEAFMRLEPAKAGVVRPRGQGEGPQVDRHARLNRDRPDQDPLEGRQPPREEVARVYAGGTRPDGIPGADPGA